MFAGSSLSQYNGTVRLSGGKQCEGEVEVYVSQRWRGVLLGSWTPSDTSVVCRQLACGSAVGLGSAVGSAGSESDGCVSGFHCSGGETHLGNCSAPQMQNCSSGQHVTIVCSGVNITMSTSDHIANLHVKLAAGDAPFSTLCQLCRLDCLHSVPVHNIRDSPLFIRVLKPPASQVGRVWRRLRWQAGGVPQRHVGDCV